MIDFKAIGQRIRQQRQLYEMTQEQFAERLDISIEHLSRIENGSQRPSLPLLERMSTFFQIEEVTLLFGIASEKDLDKVLLGKIEVLPEEKKEALLKIIDLIS
ncbi:MAG: helix-turn-helix transcriptional regulator [Clostridia bacterium]|nr:helix-turn-helix transcriptional regulator [Clostridia bacterium]MBR3553368.1 helix-turn-helix transcriptional regulator [Clostridia bacterium]